MALFRGLLRNPRLGSGTASRCKTIRPFLGLLRNPPAGVWHRFAVQKQSVFSHFDLYDVALRNRALHGPGTTTPAAATALLAAGPRADRAAQHVERGDGHDHSDSDELRVH